MKKLIRRNRFVGFIDKDILYKRVIGSKHKLRKPEGWAIDKDILEEPFKEIRILDLDTGTIYYASKQAMMKYGIDIDRGYGQQIVLPIDRWHIENKDSLFTNKEMVT